jgi:hypothetical protein
MQRRGFVRVTHNIGHDCGFFCSFLCDLSGTGEMADESGKVVRIVERYEEIQSAVGAEEKLLYWMDLYKS